MQPTPYADVNAILADLLARVQAVLGENFVGMYLYGSLATGTFDPESSDIDFLVATQAKVMPISSSKISIFALIFLHYL